MPYNPTKPNPIYLIYMYKEDLALNNLQRLICHQIQPNQSIFFHVSYSLKGGGGESIIFIT